MQKCPSLGRVPMGIPLQVCMCLSSLDWRFLACSAFQPVHVPYASLWQTLRSQTPKKTRSLPRPSVSNGTMEAKDCLFGTSGPTKPQSSKERKHCSDRTPIPFSSKEKHKIPSNSVLSSALNHSAQPLVPSHTFIQLSYLCK